METGVKTNEDMFPLSREFSFLSMFLLFFLCGSVFVFSDWASSEVENPMKLLLVGLDVATNPNFRFSVAITPIRSLVLCRRVKYRNRDNTSLYCLAVLFGISNQRGKPRLQRRSLSDSKRFRDLLQQNNPTRQERIRSYMAPQQSLIQ